MPLPTNYTHLMKKIELYLKKNYLLNILLAVSFCFMIVLAGISYKYFRETIIKQTPFNDQVIMSILHNQEKPSKKAKLILQQLDHHVFLASSIPSVMKKHLSDEDVQQINQFLNHALYMTLVNYIANSNLEPYQSGKIFRGPDNDIILLGGSYRKDHKRYMPLLFAYQKINNQWKLTDIILYTTSMTSAYRLQFKNWLLQKNVSEIMVAIRAQNAILRKKSLRAS